MNQPKICAVIVDSHPDLTKVEDLVDFFEVRIDLIGAGWQQVVKDLHKPWLATNRLVCDGGKCVTDNQARIDVLLEAASLGASFIDVELSTKNLARVVPAIKNEAKCLISHHDLRQTSSLSTLKMIVRRQLDAGADVCKLVTTATDSADNLTVLQLIREFTMSLSNGFPEQKIVSLAMGPLGLTSRVLAPLAGGYFTYASVSRGGESAPGQITVAELRNVYGTLQND